MSRPEKSFEVEIASTKAVYIVPSDKSILQVLHENGINHPFSCEEGICGTCIVRVLDGEPDHRDSILTEAERKVPGEFTPCCSRAKSPRLVLDI